MPTPPLLLCDRVLGIDGPAMKLGKGSIWTETDVKADGWYMHDGRMGGGVMIESGQADLLLISWQGIDLLNRSERVYRLLGCTLTYRGELPRAGETLRYDIHIDAHANLGPVRMFFFHYDCRVGDDLRLSVREGQAGFFTDAELADSGGILWTPEEHTPVAAEPPVATRASARRTFDRAALAAFAEGRAFECFGDGFARTASHTWTPRIAGGNLLFLDRVAWDPAGGPWGRGHLRAEQDIRPDTWFFDGHFHHDPCMPGTLMFEGCLQAMQLYLAAMGCTVDRDGWRFTPAPDVAYKLRCRGQVLPTSRLLVYELFVEELVLGPIPRLRAQVLCTVDGLKCFHADPLILELVPDWPLSRMAPPSPDGRPCVWDYASLLACAWGRPTDAFGPMYRAFDGPRKVPRLPGPPYHFMSRVVETTGEMGGARAPASVTVAYDVPPDAWYFAENGAPTMPYAVLLEAALQPCGWLASWVGCTLGTDEDLMFRNLDGTATQHREVSADSGTLTTRSRLTRLSKSAGMIIVGFQVETTDAAGPVFTMDTVFGFFPAAAFANQAGVGSTDQQRARLDQPGDGVRSPATPGLATGRLLMFDRVTVADGTYFRAEKDVIPGDWFFKAHFYQDPVQPGSLGIEAMIQLLQWAMVHRGLTAGMARPRFEPVALGEAMTWKYRGQVVPENRLITTEVDLTRVEGDTAWASASLWVDGKRIYDAKNLAMRVRDAGSSSSRIEVPVPGDHRPTWTLPALPMMSMAMLALAHGRSTELRAGQATRWLTFPDGPRSVDVAVSGQAVTLSAAGAVFFSATLAGDEPVPPVTALRDARPGFDGAELYASGRLFHGPRFQALQRVDAWGADGATATLHPDVPPDVLLDAATHAIPHDDMGQWWPEAPDGCAAYPRALRRLSLLGGPPTGPVRVEARFLGGEGRIARLSLHLLDGARLVAYVELDEILMPKGRVGRADPAARRAFLQGSFVPGLTLSDEGRLSPMDVAATDWLPGTVEAVFGTRDAAEIAAKEVVGQALGLHPRRVVVTGDLAGDPARPLTRHRVTRQDGRTTSEPARLAPVFDWWRARLDSGPWPGEGILSRLADAFLGELVLHAPLPTSPCLFLANHETYLESVLFCIVVSALGGRPVRALAKTEHREAWLGGLHELLVSYPGREQPAMIVYFDQSDPASLPVLVRDACAERSLLVHVEGTRQERSGQPVERISSLWIDLGVPIVPVAFRGGADGRKRDVPPGRQDVHIGPVLMPAELAALPYAARAKAVREAINALPSRAAVVEQPEAAPREAIDRAVGPALADADAGWVARWRAWVAG
jgi:3-hydroxymyristoyl/3-hydroxydecanoyl-(acyl carrier protein) dehydratase/1-acyl-sn-glycerol-3-phosphate acyltransferase